MGMSLSITGYMIVLVLAWTSTKATPFGRLIARREYDALDKLFQRTLGQSLIVFALIAVIAISAVAALAIFAPSLAHRMVPLNIFVLMVVAACANCVVQSVAIMLRAFKSEPFLVQSLLVAALTLGMATLAAGRWGAMGAAASYLIATGGVALPSAFRIYQRMRRTYLKVGSRVLVPHGEPA
jgi:O-antigen/teichoic acid export membrane protein